MMKSILFAGLVAAIGGAAQAEHAVPPPEGDLVPVVTREICELAEWGDQARTDCRTAVYLAPKPNPALSGICTIYYGRRICH